MLNIFESVTKNLNIFDLSVFFIFTYCIIQCFIKGFSLSLMSFMKWVISTIVTIILVPKLEPYVSDYINNDYITGIGLGIAVYIITLFVLILAGKSLGRLFSYTGMGSVDKVFGMIFLPKSNVLKFGLGKAWFGHVGGYRKTDEGHFVR